MNFDSLLGGGLGNLPLLSNSLTRSISAENPTGEPSGGAHTDPRGVGPASRLGKGWKTRPYLTLKPGSITTLAEITGPGAIQHIWITVDVPAYRSCILRIYWDGEDTPSVEAPVADFFANSHGLRYDVNSLPVVVNPRGGFNCYWPMPFRGKALITVENQHFEEIRAALSLERRARDLMNSLTWSLLKSATTCPLMYSEPLSVWKP